MSSLGNFAIRMLVSVLLILLAQNFSYPSFPKVYHWRKLPQVSCLSRQKFCCSKHTFVAINMCLLQQNTSFVVTKVCLPQQNFCQGKIMFVRAKYFVQTRADPQKVQAREELESVCRVLAILKIPQHKYHCHYHYISLS